VADSDSEGETSRSFRHSKRRRAYEEGLKNLSLVQQDHLLKGKGETKMGKDVSVLAEGEKYGWRV